MHEPGSKELKSLPGFGEPPLPPVQPTLRQVGMMNQVDSSLQILKQQLSGKTERSGKPGQAKKLPPGWSGDGDWTELGVEPGLG